MLINHMQSAFLMGETLSLTAFHKARVRVFAFFSSNFDKGVMTFFYVYAEQVLRGKVLATA